MEVSTTVTTKFFVQEIKKYKVNIKSVVIDLNHLFYSTCNNMQRSHVCNFYAGTVSGTLVMELS